MSGYRDVMYALRELHSGVRVLFNLVPPPGDRVTSGFTQYLQYTGQNVCTNSVTLKTYYNKGVPGSRVHQGVLGCGVLAVDRADAHSVVRDESRCGRASASSSHTTTLVWLEGRARVAERRRAEGRTSISGRGGGGAAALGPAKKTTNYAHTHKHIQQEVHGLAGNSGLAIHAAP